MPSEVIHLPESHYQRVRWANGQGWTRDIHREPDTESFAWCASIAEIDQNTCFSPYSGYQRAQVLLRGEALRLDFADGRTASLSQIHERIRFDGSDVPFCQLSDSPVHVFNAIWDPAQVDVTVLHRPLVGPMLFLHQAGVSWFLYLLAGQAQLRHDRHHVLNQGDSMILRPAADDRLVLEGGGELLLLRLDAARDSASGINGMTLS